MTALVVDHVVKQFGNHTAVADISFRIPRGVVYGILGPNGAGKTTTLRMINDIIAPDRGEIVILDGLKPGVAAARRIGYLPEERGLYPKMVVMELLEFMGTLRGLTRGVARERAKHWLARLGLTQWEKNKVQDLSKGMQQKVQFATALLHEPELVILDEPWSGLDPINAEVLREVVVELRASGRTVVFSTHLMEQAEKLCDAVCIIARGKKVLDGSLRELKQAAAAKGVLAIGLASAQARERAEGVLADRSLVLEHRVLDQANPHELELKLIAGREPSTLLAALLSAQVELLRFEVVTPTLHKIFVTHAGDQAAVAERSEEQAP